MGPMPEPQPMVQVIRGGRIESVHHGSYVLMQAGEIVAQAGDPQRLTYYRSCSKPFQSMAAVTTGAADRFGLDAAMLAIGAGSHNAEPEQLATVRRMLGCLGLEASTLGCGGHWSLDPETARTQIQERDGATGPLSRLWSNCSGNHAAMLAATLALGAPVGTYLDAAHPAQVEITRILAAFTELALEDIAMAVDGCGAPVHGVPLSAVARSMMNLGRPEALPDDLRAGATRIVAAMHTHPDMVAGVRRFDTDLMRTASLTLVAKAGAEGVHGTCVPKLGLGLAVKVEDGSDRGYRHVVIEVLRRHGALTDDEAAALRQLHGETLTNWEGAAVGHLEVAV